MNENPIHTLELYKEYDNKSVALKNLSLTIKSGEIFGLIGQNGAGKTTLMKILLGFSAPTKGKVEIYGKKNSIEFKTRIGYLPEKVMIHPFLTAFEFLYLCGKLYFLNKKTLKEKCISVLERVGLGDKLGIKVGTFSKGMTQRLGLAQAIIHEPDLLFLDEPGSGLDPLGMIELRNIILDEHKSRNATIFINSHRLLEAEKLCSRIAILHRGEMVASGSMNELTRTKNQINVKVEALSEPLEKYFGSIGNQIHIEGNEISFDPKESVELKQIPMQIIQNGGNILKYEIVNENLEEIFLRLTGGEK